MYSTEHLTLIKNISTTESMKIEMKLKEHYGLNMRQIHLLTERGKELASLIDATEDNLTLLRREAKGE